jgi:GNAT superfamily N-acetyltransferase
MKIAEITTGGDAVPGGYNGHFVAWSDTGEKLGYLDYQTIDESSRYFNNTVLIAMIEVEERFQRQGVATELLEALKREFPGREVDPGMMTEQGAAWWSSEAVRDLDYNWENWALATAPGVFEALGSASLADQVRALPNVTIANANEIGNRFERLVNSLSLETLDINDRANVAALADLLLGVLWADHVEGHSDRALETAVHFADGCIDSGASVAGESAVELEVLSAYGFELLRDIGRGILQQPTFKSVMDDADRIKCLPPLAQDEARQLLRGGWLDTVHLTVEDLVSVCQATMASQRDIDQSEFRAQDLAIDGVELTPEEVAELNTGYQHDLAELNVRDVPWPAHAVDHAAELASV